MLGVVFVYLGLALLLVGALSVLKPLRFLAIRSRRRGVTAREIRLFRVLTWLRSPHLGETRESILNPSPDRPILEVALSSGFVPLAEVEDREIVFGTLVIFPPGFRRESLASTADFAALRDPGYAKAVMSFHFTDRGDGSTLLETETRVFATSADARRRFARYWRLIYPGSSLIRRMWLQAIRERAEGG